MNAIVPGQMPVTTQIASSIPGNNIAARRFIAFYNYCITGYIPPHNVNNKPSFLTNTT